LNQPTKATKTIKKHNSDPFQEGYQLGSSIARVVAPFLFLGMMVLAAVVMFRISRWFWRATR
jgi:hypothetical protein